METNIGQQVCDAVSTSSIDVDGCDKKVRDISPCECEFTMTKALTSGRGANEVVYGRYEYTVTVVERWVPTDPE